MIVLAKGKIKKADEKIKSVSEDLEEVAEYAVTSIVELTRNEYLCLKRAELKGHQVAIEFVTPNEADLPAEPVEGDGRRPGAAAAPRRRGGMSPETLALTEKQFQSQVIELAELLGWEWYHPTISPLGQERLARPHALPRAHHVPRAEARRREDLPGHPEAAAWIDTIPRGWRDVGVWRPEDWERIKAELQERTD